MDTLVQGGIVVSCDDHGEIVHGDVLIQGDRIAQVGKIAPKGPVRCVDARGCAVLPGFVQAHVHLCQVLMRGMADDLPLLEWLTKRIWPLEAAHNEKSLGASAKLGLVEMMKAGTTSILDMGTVRDHDVVMEACLSSGIRAISGKTMMDAVTDGPKRLRETAASSLDESDSLHREWHGKGNGRIHYAYSPRFILSTSESIFRGVVERSRENGAIIHTHASEHPGEKATVRHMFGGDDVDILSDWGFCGPKAVLAHGVQVTDRQAKRICREGTRIIHCPSANLKLGSGIARVAKLLELGVAMGLGADGAPCNNNLDPWMELRHAALLSKVTHGETSLPARRALRLATVDGARALGFSDVGMIAPGFKADLQVVRLDAAHQEPGGDVFSKLVYATKAQDVKHVWVDGNHVIRNGQHSQFDEQKIIAIAREEGRKIASRAGI